MNALPTCVQELVYAQMVRQEMAKAYPNICTTCGNPLIVPEAPPKRKRGRPVGALGWKAREKKRELEEKRLQEQANADGVNAGGEA